MPRLEYPYLDKLPPDLFGKAFVKINDGLYKFHDATFSIDCRHMLGAARELIHCLTKLKPEQWPNWLVFNGFKRVGEQYQLCSTDKKFDKDQMLKWGEEAQAAVEAADVHTDPWGNTSHDEWHENIGNHLPNDPVMALARKAIPDPLEFYAFLNNWKNSIHHPEYPSKKE
jgi:hypothetical protein